MTGHSREDGYSLVTLMVAVAIMLIMMTAAVPSWRYLMKNDREEELISRGGEIADAIARYQRKNGNALPPSLEVLVKGKFLRHAYKDPMTKDGKWRFIRPGEPMGPMTPGASGTGGSTGSTGSGSGSGGAGSRTGSGFGNSGSSGSGFGGPGSTGPGSTGSGSTGSGSTGSGSTGSGSTGSGFGSAGSSESGFGSSRGGSPSESGRGSSFSQSGQMMGGFQGVASTSTEKSLRVFNGRTRYNEWLFLPGQPRVIGRPVGPAVPQPGGGVRPPGASSGPGSGSSLSRP
jgi:type II secretory pathway pseudopilin PulG